MLPQALAFSPSSGEEALPLPLPAILISILPTYDEWRLAFLPSEPLLSGALAALEFTEECSVEECSVALPRRELLVLARTMTLASALVYQRKTLGAKSGTMSARLVIVITAITTCKRALKKTEQKRVSAFARTFKQRTLCATETAKAPKPAKLGKIERTSRHFALIS